MKTASTDSLTIRRATPKDAPSIGRLAMLDSTRAHASEWVVAESAGAVLAAVSLDGRERIADPFTRTAEIVDLLALRAAQLERASAPSPVGVAVAPPLAA